MTAEVDIAIRALQKLGAESITSLDDNSKSAREMKTAFPFVRDAELRKHPWTFAKKRVVLAPLSSAPAFGFTYAYQLPSDYIRIVKQIDDSDYEIEGNELLTDQGTKWNLIYIRRVEDVNDMDPMFREALACALAMELAESFTQSNSKKEYARRSYIETINSARKNNSIMRQAKKIPTSSWVTARY